MNMTKSELRSWLLENAFTASGRGISPVWGKKYPEMKAALLQHTSFFDEKIGLPVRVMAFLNGQTRLNRCMVCGQSIEPRPRNPEVYCSFECSNSSPLTKEKREKASLERFGCANPAQSKEVSDKIATTNMYKYGTPFSRQSHIPQESLDRLNDRNWLSDRHIKRGISGSAIAHELGVSKSLVNRRMRDLGIPVVSVHRSTGEEHLVRYISEIYDGGVQTNCRSLIPPLELDIYLPDVKLAVEYDGVFWHSESSGKNSRYHLNKTLECQKRGVQLLHVFDTDDPDIWKSVIRAKLGLCNRLYARNLQIGPVRADEARAFLVENHLQGAVNGSLRLGLWGASGLMSLMTFGKPRFDRRHDWELLRFCTRKGYQVIGGASKLLKHSGVESCISYANRRWSDGKLYEALGFKWTRGTSPNYFYTKDHKHLYSRNQFQRHKLRSKLADFDESLSAHQNALNHGYDRVWDCGSHVYTLGS